MKYIEAIEKRQSIREFRKKELSDKQIAEIKEFYGSFKPLIPEIGTELVVSTGEEIGTRLEGSAGYRGHSFNAPAYITILSEVKDHYLINAGYLAENILLKLVEMDIDHCWLTTNGSDNVKRALFLGDKDKEAVVVIACGFGKKERSLTRLDIQTPILIDKGSVLIIIQTCFYPITSLLGSHNSSLWGLCFLCTHKIWQI